MRLLWPGSWFPPVQLLGPRRDDDNRLRFVVRVVVIASLALAFARGVVFKRIETGDEGVNGTMALNMCRSLALVVRPSYIPGGSEDWVGFDLPGIGNTPFHSVLLALGGCPLGGRPEAMGLVSFAALAATLCFTYRLVALWERRAALLTTLLLALSPAVLWQFRLMEAEPVLVAWGMAGTYWIARGELTGRNWHSLLGGACLGLGFLTKLWLVTPFVLASLGLLAIVRLQRRQLALVPVACITVGFLATASLHLALVALRSPTDVALWLTQVYFAPFLGQSIGGSKLAGAGVPTEWSHPSWYYPAILYREHFFLCPLLLAALPALKRRAPTAAGLFGAIGFGLASLVPLSLPAIKESLYILGVLPFLYGLAGLGASALFAREGTLNPRRAPARRALRVAGYFSAAAVLLIGAAHARGLKRDDITPVYVGAHALGVGGAWLLAYAAARIERARATALIGGLSALSLAGFGAYELTAPQPPYKEIAEILRPYLEPLPPGHESFISPRYKVLQLYLFRNGRYWQSFYTELRPETLVASIASGEYCAFVFGPEEREDPRLVQMERDIALQALDLSAELPEGARGGFRVFVNRACVQESAKGLRHAEG
ncbi:phospholipid carrier-dependent glycosyltransferase [Corallococcus exiguus]|uniref:phospholipid carrier-dependent glycosyltransferase n=1 Tax=Corallococcus exiguus TaxID=83462 RepID=UPI003DA676D5